MAFEFTRIPGAELDAALLTMAEPSRDFVHVKDERLLQLLPDCHWIRGTVNGAANCLILGEDWLKVHLYRFLRIPLEVLPQQPAVSFVRVRFALTAIQRLLVTCEAEGLVTDGTMKGENFLQDIKRVLRSLNPQATPALVAADLEISPSLNWNDPAFATYSHTRWLHTASLQQLRQSDLRSRDFGFLCFCLEPHWDAADRLAETATFESLCCQWAELVSEERFGGKQPTNVRPAVFANFAAQQLERTAVWESTRITCRGSVEREMELLHQLQLVSTVERVRETAFSQKVLHILTHDDKAAALRRLLQSTRDNNQLMSWYQRIALEFVPSQVRELHSLYSAESLLTLNRVLLEGTRLDFVDMAEYTHYSDSDRVEHLVKLRSKAVAAAGVAAKVVVGNAEFDAVIDTPASSFGKVEMMYNSKRFQAAVVAVRDVLRRKHVKQGDVVAECLKTGIPFIVQFILGKRNVSGHDIWSELSEHRLTWGSNGTVESVIGYAMGQAAIRARDNYEEGTHLGFTFASKVELRKKSPVVNCFLKGEIENLSMENEVLSYITKELGDVPLPVVSERQRFTTYVYLDQMAQYLTPVFEMWGCGPATQPDSFASVLNYCKKTILKAQSMEESRRETLIHGEVGMRAIVESALKCASARFKAIMLQQDPSVEIPLAFMIGTDQPFKHDIREQSKAIEDQRRIQKFVGVSGELLNDESTLIVGRQAAVLSMPTPASGKHVLEHWKV